MIHRYVIEALRAGLERCPTATPSRWLEVAAAHAALIYTEDLDWTAPEQAEQTKEYQEFGEKAAAVIRGGSALYPTSTATTVVVRGGRGGDVVTSDGPYAETKEVFAGFYLLECADLDDAIRWAQQIPGAWRGAVEVRPVIPRMSALS